MSATEIRANLITVPACLKGSGLLFSAYDSATRFFGPKICGECARTLNRRDYYVAVTHWEEVQRFIEVEIGRQRS